MKDVKVALVIGAMALLSLLSLKRAQQLGKWLGRRLYKSGPDSGLCRATRVNVEVCFPALTEDEREALIRESLEQTGCSLAESGISWFWKPERALKTVVAVEGEALIRDELEAGRGILLIAPHLGNWEVMNLYLSRHYPVTAMYKPPRQKMLNDLILKRRGRLGSSMAPADAKGVRMVLKALRRGEIVGILPDQEPERESGVYAPFFGQPALTMKLFPQLAAQTGVKVVCGYAHRLPDGAGFELRFSEADPGINSKDLLESAQALNRSIERCVSESPAQYQWEYKRFNTREDGARGPYGKRR
ncbi:MAG: lauroyl acyltransferase [Oceanospirillaceae bacterium]|nr:lauroyl acyltransferase [Oceanospirillaceae bacterium]